jgi:hypothetical protein
VSRACLGKKILFLKREGKTATQDKRSSERFIPLRRTQLEVEQEEQELQLEVVRGAL